MSSVTICSTNTIQVSTFLKLEWDLQIYKVNFMCFSVRICIYIISERRVKKYAKKHNKNIVTDFEQVFMLHLTILSTALSKIKSFF